MQEELRKPFLLLLQRFPQEVYAGLRTRIAGRSGRDNMAKTRRVQRSLAMLRISTYRLCSCRL